jgi:hypothetical protein
MTRILCNQLDVGVDVMERSQSGCLAFHVQNVIGGLAVRKSKTVRSQGVRTLSQKSFGVLLGGTAAEVVGKQRVDAPQL